MVRGAARLGQPDHKTAGRCGRTVMIGVVAKPEDRETVREFFELFKTPWEFCRANVRYEVLLQGDGTSAHPPADLVLLYGSQPNAFDYERKRLPGPVRREATLSWHGERIPLYGRSVPFSSHGRAPELVFEDTRQPLASVVGSARGTILRVGFRLVQEVFAR